MIVDFSIAPIGREESLSAYVAEAYAIVEASGLSHEFHAMGTNIEGDWDEVMPVLNACRLRLREMADRVSISIRIDDRTGPADRLDRKVLSARRKLPPRP